MNAAPQSAPKASAKAKVNLTTVIPMAPPVDAEAMDTTTPMDTSVIRFTQLHIPKWGPWLLDRMQQFWPHLNGFNYGGILGQLMADPGTMFIRARKAIMLATVTRGALEARPVCDIVFCFKHHPDDEQENKDVRLLFRWVEDWARRQGVSEIRVLRPDRLDTTYSRTKEALYGEDVRIIVKGLDK